MSPQTMNQGRGSYGKSTLRVLSPHMRGTDVGHLQARLDDVRLDRRFKDLQLPRVGRDHDFGSGTADAVELFETLIGFPSRYVNGIATPMTLKVANDPHYELAGNVPFSAVTAHTWALRGGRKRNARRAHLAWLAAHGGKAGQAVDYGLLFDGLLEQPSDSNAGPNVTRGGKKGGISLWEGVAGMGHDSWCGAFVIGCYHFGAGIELPHGWVYVPTLSDDARAGRHGARTVGFSSARKGDILVFSFGAGRQHTGMVQHRIDSDRVLTIEGNTSPGNSGSQSNGGGVHQRVRYRQNIVDVVRVG